MKSFLNKTITDPNPNTKLYKNFTNPMSSKDFIMKNTQFIMPESETSQTEIALNIEDSFYQKVEWKKQELLPETKENSLKNSSETQPNISISSKYSFQSGEENSKKEVQLKNFSKDLKESLKKLDMIIAEKKNSSKQSLKKEEDLLNKKEYISNIILKEETKANIKPNDEEIYEKMENFEYFNININKEIENKNMNSLKILPVASNNENEPEDPYKQSKESLNMQEIIKEAHNQLFDPNFLSEVDPATYTNPLFLIGFFCFIKFLIKNFLIF